MQEIKLIPKSKTKTWKSQKISNVGGEFKSVFKSKFKVQSTVF